MRLNKLLSSAAIMTVLIGTAVGFGTDSWAEKGVVLSPQTGWAVTNVADDGSGGGAYCAMARRFKDNLILTVARNNNDETSFALDFPNGNFDTRQSFSVVLDPGAGEQRNYDVQPVSKRAFVIRLGHDQAFFDALSKTGILRAEIGDDVYNFSLPDMAGGQDQLTQCLKSNGSNSQSASASSSYNNAAAAPAPAPSADAEQYRKDMAALQDKIDALHAQNDRLAQVLEKGTPATEPVAPVAVAPSASDMEQIKRLNDQVSSLIDENAALKSQVDTMQQNSSKSSSSNEVMQSEIDRLRNENSALNTRLASVQSQTNDQSDMARKVQSLQEENTHLTVLLQNTNDSFKKLADESQHLQQDLSQQSSAAGQVDSLNAKIAALESDNSKLQQDLASARSASDVRNSVQARSLEDTNKLLQAQLSSAQEKQKQVDAMSQQLKLAEAENGYLKEQITTIGKSQDDRLKQQSEEMQQQIIKLQNDLQTSQAKADSIQGLQMRIQQITDEREKLAADNAKLNADLAAANSKVDGEMKQKILALESENNDLKTSATKDLSDIVSSKSEVTRLQGKVQQLEAERNNLTQTLANAQGNLETKVNGEIDFLTKENDRLKTALDQEQHKTASLQTLQAQYDALQAENQKLKTDVIAANAQGSSVSAQMQNLLDDNTRMKADLAAAQAQKTQVADLTYKVQSLEADNKRLNDALAVTKDSSTNIQSAEFARLQAENSRLQKDLDTQKMQVAATGSTPAEVQQKLDDLQKANQELASNVETLRAENDGLKKGAPLAAASNDKALESLKAENETLKAENDKLKTATLTPNELQEQVANLKLENQILRDKAAKDAQAKDKAHQDEIAGLQQQVSDLKAQNDVLNGNLESAEKALKEKQMAPPMAQAQPAPMPTKAPKAVAEAAPAKVSEEKAEAKPTEVSQAETDQSVSEAAPEPQTEETSNESSNGSKKSYARPQGSQNEAQAMEAELNGELQDLKEAKKQVDVVSTAAPAPENVANVTPALKPVEAEPLADKAPAAAEAPSTPVKSIGSILQQADINLDQPMATGPGSAGAGSTLYHWNSGPMMGMAEQQPLKSDAQFDMLAQQYLEKAQKDCQGDFAVMLDRTEDIGKTRIDSYEAACVGGQVNSGATLVFYNQDGTFTALAHKAKTTDMDATMEARDRLVAAIAKSAG